jgi:hypothetical protein
MKLATIAAAFVLPVLTGTALGQDAFKIPAPFSAPAKARAADCSTAKDLKRPWLYTYEQDGKPFACVLALNKRGKVVKLPNNTPSFCVAGVPGSLQFPLSGKIVVNESCIVLGQLKVEGLDEYFLSAQMAADKSTIAGVLFLPNEPERFLPVAFTEWGQSAE